MNGDNDLCPHQLCNRSRWERENDGAECQLPTCPFLPVSPTEPKARGGEAWECAARIQPNGPDDPADCDWPVCGCDPYASKVLEALYESGDGIVRLVDSLTTAQALLRRWERVVASEQYRAGEGGLSLSAHPLADDTREYNTAYYRKLMKLLREPSDSDGSPEGRDAQRLDGKAATARAEGIAQPHTAQPLTKASS